MVSKLGACVACGRATSGSLEWCAKHYKEFQRDIKEHKPWTRLLKNEEQRDRRRRKKEHNDQSLDEMLERSEYNRPTRGQDY